MKPGSQKGRFRAQEARRKWTAIGCAQSARLSMGGLPGRRRERRRQHPQNPARQRSTVAGWAEAPIRTSEDALLMAQGENLTEEG